MAACQIYLQRVERALRRERVFKDRSSQLETLNDGELITRYRMPRHAILNLLQRVRPLLTTPTKRSKSLSPETQLLLSLRYLSKGGFLLELGDLHGVSEASVCRAFHRTVNALCTTLPQITFPTREHYRKTQQEFYKIAAFPKVIGAIDCTIIPIKKPSDDEAAFVCRKGYHSLNVQAVCDADLRFLNAVVRWPGSTHDAFILSNSHLGQALEGNENDGWLLGDSGYPCRSWLMTPVQNPITRGEERYNYAHIRTRNTIERAFGVLKSRFRCLHKSTGCLQFKPAKCTKIVMASFLLHNFCIDLRLPTPEEIEDDLNGGGEVEAPGNQDGQRVRQNLIQTVFA